MVCERWWLTKMCVCVRDGVWEMVCERWCVTKWRRRREEAGGGGGEEPGIQNQKQVGNKSSEHFETTWFLLLSTRFISFLLPEFQEAHPITKDLRQQVPVPLNMPKHSRKSPANVRNPSVISPEPLPKTTRKPFRGHGCICRPRPPWPPQRSAARPRRHGLCQPPHAAPSGLGAV